MIMNPREEKSCYLKGSRCMANSLSDRNLQELWGKERA